MHLTKNLARAAVLFAVLGGTLNFVGPTQAAKNPPPKEEKPKCVKIKVGTTWIKSCPLK